MKITNNLKKTWNIITNTLVAMIVIIALMLVGVRLFGLRAYTVLSGSMEPTYHTGSLIYVKEIEASKVELDQPITFVLNEELTVATHRVIEIDTENQQFYTKGDANQDPDASPVHFKNLIGVPVFTIPYLGYVASYIQSPPGIYIAITAGALLLLIMFVPELLKKEKNKQSKESKNLMPAV